MDEATLQARLIAILHASPRLMRVLTLARALDLPDWRLVSGAVYQPVWNALTGRDPDYGVKDYDLCYFDPDPSWEAEDAAIQRAAAFLPPEFAPLVEVRNQARVHLWFEDKFGEPYTPLANTDAMLERFVSPAFAVGVRLLADGAIDVAAPFGLADCFAMRLRPNPRRTIGLKNFQRATASCLARWPEVRVVL